MEHCRSLPFNNLTEVPSDRLDTMAAITDLYVNRLSYELALVPISRSKSRPGPLTPVYLFIVALSVFFSLLLLQEYF